MREDDAGNGVLRMTNQEKKDLWNAVLAWQSKGYSEQDTVKQLKYTGRASSTIRTYYRAVAEVRGCSPLTHERREK